MGEPAKTHEEIEDKNKGLAATDVPDYDMIENDCSSKDQAVASKKKEIVNGSDLLSDKEIFRASENDVKANRIRRWNQPTTIEEPPAKKPVDFHEAQFPSNAIRCDASSGRSAGDNTPGQSILDPSPSHTGTSPMTPGHEANKERTLNINQCDELPKPDCIDADTSIWLETLRTDHYSEIENMPLALNHWIGLFESWSNKERLAALEYLIASDICDAGQIRHLYSLIEPQLQRDFISLLPKELALYVLHFLEPKDLLKAAQTCRTWRILCEDNLLWREKCQEEGLMGEGEFLSSASGFNRSSSSSTYHHNSSHDSIPFIRSEYKKGYLRLKTIEHNWRFGRFPNDSSSDQPSPSVPSARHPQPQQPAPAPVPVPAPSSQQSQEPKVKHPMLKDILHLKGHDDHVITCLQFNPASNLIVSGSDDNTLKVWSSHTGKCLRTLTGHTGGVWSSQLSPNNIVISGSTDRTLKIWDALSGRCKHTLYGHTSTVRCMALHGNQVVSGSRDTTLRVWDINTGNCNHVLVGHCAAVRCVQFNGTTVVSGAYDFLVKVWDAKTETCLHTLDGHNNRVYSLQFDGENIVSGSLDTSIRVWSASTGQSKHILTGHQSLTSGMQLRGNVLVSGNADSTVKVWDINTGECLATLAGEHKHQSAVTCLQFNSKFVITSSDDGTVKLWDLATGEFIRNLVTLSSGGSGGVVWRIRASHTKLVCAVGSRNGTEETKLLVLDFDTDDLNLPQTETSRPCSNDSRSIAL